MGASTNKDKKELFQYLRREVGDEKVLEAMSQIPRDIFVPAKNRYQSYKNIPLPIGEGQTISQPLIVAIMTSALDLRGNEIALELGTGSGYQAAILSHLLPRGHLLTLERVPSLAKTAEIHLRNVGCSNVEVRIVGRELGCPAEGPFDAIMVTAAAPRLPAVLLEHMAPGARLVIPIGTQTEQELVKVIRTDEGHTVKMLGPCKFVPLIGQDAWPEKPGKL